MLFSTKDPLKAVSGPGFVPPQFAYRGNSRELPLAVERVAFDLRNKVLIGFPKNGLPLATGHRLETFEPCAIDWLPNMPALQANALMQQAGNFELRCELLPSAGIKLIPPLLTMAVTPALSPGDLLGLLTQQQMLLLWHGGRKQFICGVTLPVLAGGRILAAPQWAGLLHGGKVEIQKWSVEVDFANPAATISQSASDMLFTDDGRHAVLVTPATKDKASSLAVHLAASGRAVKEYPFSPAGKAGKLGRVERIEAALTKDNHAVGLVRYSQDSAIVLQDLISGKMLGKPLIPESTLLPVPGVELVPQRGLVAWVRQPCLLEVWQLPDRQLVLREKLAGPPASLQFSEFGRHLAVIGEKPNSVRVFTFSVGSADDLRAPATQAGQTPATVSPSPTAEKKKPKAGRSPSNATGSPASQTAPPRADPHLTAESAMQATLSPLQQEIDQAPAGGTVELRPGVEYPGNIVVRKPLTLSGRGATLWGKSGPLVTIASAGVQLRELRIEVTGDNPSCPEEELAILVTGGHQVGLDNIEVKGTVHGLREQGAWRYPSSLHLGRLAHGSQHRVSLRLWAAANCRIAAEVEGLAFHPKDLKSGLNDVILSIDNMSNDTFLFGRIVLDTGHLKRWWSISAHVVNAADAAPSAATPPLVWEPTAEMLASLPPTPAAGPPVKKTPTPPTAAAPPASAPPAPTAAPMLPVPPVPPVASAPPPQPSRPVPAAPPAPSVSTRTASVPSALFSPPAAVAPPAMPGLAPPVAAVPAAPIAPPSTLSKSSGPTSPAPSFQLPITPPASTPASSSTSFVKKRSSIPGGGIFGGRAEAAEVPPILPPATGGQAGGAGVASRPVVNAPLGTGVFASPVSAPSSDAPAGTLGPAVPTSGKPSNSAPDLGPPVPSSPVPATSAPLPAAATPAATPAATAAASASSSMVGQKRSSLPMGGAFGTRAEPAAVPPILPQSGGAPSGGAPSGRVPPAPSPGASGSSRSAFNAPLGRGVFAGPGPAQPEALPTVTPAPEAAPVTPAPATPRAPATSSSAPTFRPSSIFDASLSVPGAKTREPDSLQSTESIFWTPPTAPPPELPQATNDTLAEQQGNTQTKGDLGFGELPKRLNQYLILSELGRGGMGAVYMAEHEMLRKIVALKVLKPELTTGPEFVERFRREMLAVGRLDHANIIRALDAGECDGMMYLTMEFVPGRDLQKHLQEHGRMPLHQACELIRQAAEGLQHAHQHHLVHRDVKPSNLFLSTQGQVKILDLGLARITGEDRPVDISYGQCLGTPDYMAPEQWESHVELDGRADLYSLGCTLFAFLAGRPPFSEAVSIYAKGVAHLNTPTPDIRKFAPDVPAPVALLILRLMEKNRDLRPASAAEVVAALLPYCVPGPPSWFGSKK